MANGDKLREHQVIDISLKITAARCIARAHATTYPQSINNALRNIYFSRRTVAILRNEFNSRVHSKQYNNNN